MSLFGWLFGAPKAAEKVLDGVMNAADKLVFTDEERAEMAAKTREWFLKYLEASKPQNVARRLIAIVVSGAWVACIAIALVAKALGSDAYAAYALKVLSDVVLTPFSIIIGFYFAAHVVRAGKGGQ